MKIEVDSKKELILNTALSLLAKNGFAKTTLDDIASALGMKKSSLYYYYQNKDALLQDVIDREQQRFCNSSAARLRQICPFLTS
jgi:AcrR family transcriptional regulator